MAKLYFRYGSMNSGKSLDILKVLYNYREKNKNILLLTSSVDNRYGVGKVKSRVGLEADALIINESTNIEELFLSYKDIDCILVDESQFLNKDHIFQLSRIVDIYNVPVIAYGLRSDFKLNPFEGSSYLMAIADDIEEIKTICFCGKKATVNARIQDGRIVKEGDQILIGGNNEYISLCRKHYHEWK